jgi:hypothetical protein
MQSQGSANHFVSIGLNFGITVLCVFPTWIILSELEGSHEVRVMNEGVETDRKLGDQSVDIL